MNDRQQAALDHPCVTAQQTFHDRYRRTVGDIHTILTVVKYAGLFDGEPVWHASADVRDADRVPRERRTWTRRDQRQTRKAVMDLLEHVGLSIQDWIDPPGQDVRYAYHVVRPLRASEAARLPVRFRQLAEPL